MAAYERVTLNRGGRNSRFDCTCIIGTVELEEQCDDKFSDP